MIYFRYSVDKTILNAFFWKWLVQFSGKFMLSCYVEVVIIVLASCFNLKRHRVKNEISNGKNCSCIKNWVLINYLHEPNTLSLIFILYWKFCMVSRTNFTLIKIETLSKNDKLISIVFVHCDGTFSNWWYNLFATKKVWNTSYALDFFKMRVELVFCENRFVLAFPSNHWFALLLSNRISIRIAKQSSVFLDISLSGKLFSHQFADGQHNQIHENIAWMVILSHSPYDMCLCIK